MGVSSRAWLKKSRIPRIPEPSPRCPIHNSAYAHGSQCWFCKTGYGPKDMDASLMPVPADFRGVGHLPDHDEQNHHDNAPRGQLDPRGQG